ncbi:MAG: TIGR02996 domain-containing protein [Deltaproteobacteria bacterium]|nr:TIGR02996 domain-containing protein [Deltaproteobacteria bacterium]
MLWRWIEALADFPVDPRIPTAVVRASCAFAAHEAGRARTAAFKLTQRTGDLRVTPILEQLSRHKKRHIADPVKRLLAKFSGAPPSLPVKDGPTLSTIEALLDTLEAAPWSEGALVESILPDKKAEAEEALLAEIYRDPDADDPRLVYADWLLERDDPRGELIMLQYERQRRGKLSTKATRREKELIQQHGHRWIHPLDAVLTSARFARGFLSGGTVVFKTERQRQELATCDLWKTVEEIDACNDELFLLEPILCSLQRASLSAEALASLCRKDRPIPLRHAQSAFIDTGHVNYSRASSWTRPSVQGDREWWIDQARPMDLSYWQTICEVGALEALTSLSLSPANHYYARQCAQISAYSWLIDGKLGGQLEQLELDCDNTPIRLSQWIDALHQGKLPKLTRLQARFAPDDFYDSPNYSYPKRPCNLVLELLRGADGALSLSLRFDWPIHRDKLRPIAPLLTAALKGLRRAKLTTITLRYSKNKRGVDLSRLEEMEALVAPLVPHLSWG